jgi:hypothetical protein
MFGTAATTIRHPLAIIASVMLFAACAEQAPLAPDRAPAARAEDGALSDAGRERAVAVMRRATARYHDLNVAVGEGFVFLHGCENRPDEGPVGTVYVHPGRLMDGRLDLELPEALVYEPARGPDGRPKLVAVEFAIPYSLWPSQEPPRLLGATFQPEDEFGVFGLHAWIWRQNPEGLFAESNPRVSCGETM